MASLTIFIHGIGSNSKAWKKFIEIQKFDNDTKSIKEYVPSKNISGDINYYFLYEYASKKFATFPLNQFIQEKLRGKTNPDKISLESHTETFLYEISDFTTTFDEINIVAHSMGGVITMKMITSLIDDKNGIKDKIKQCILYGSPLKGSNDPSFLEELWNKAPSKILHELKPDSKTIIDLLEKIELNSKTLKRDFNIYFIAGDADPRIVTIDKTFVNKFGVFKKIQGGHSEIITPKDINAKSFRTYKEIILKDNIKKQDTIEEFGDSLLSNYINQKLSKFSTESNSLKTLSNDIFVNIFDITNNGNKIEEDDNLSYLNFLCQEKSIKFLLSNYGMGKSTITKQLFEYINTKTDKKALFINLHLQHLSYFFKEQSEDEFYTKVFTSKLFEEVITDWLKDNDLIFSKKDLFQYYFNLLKKGKLILLFDGLDEVNILSKDGNAKAYLKNVELDSFIDTVCSSNYSVFITCRKEYTPFYNRFHYYKNTIEVNEIELLEWGRNQWEQYIKSLKQVDKENIINFKRDILAHKYGDLPKRPLFLSMLTELIIYGNKGVSNIEPELVTNLAEIYNKYIDFCLDKDVNTKSQEMTYVINNKVLYKEAWKKLLIHLAYLEYKTNKQVSLNQIVSIATSLDINEMYYKRDIIESTLDSTALFSIIHREHNANGFKFSHKSFLEYLVAYKLAEDIFSEHIEDAFCNEAWKLYQTLEVHHHFMAEVVRIAFNKKIIKLRPNKELSYTQLFSNKHIEEAFKKVLINYSQRMEEIPDTLLTLHEDYQAIIYYIGKFKINNLKNYLDDIVMNEHKYHPIYFRTVSLSLSSINEEMSFCDKYVLRLIDNILNGDGTLFYENLNIQKKYHGAEPKKLRKRLEKNLDKFLTSDDVINNISLIILAYFTTFIVNDEEIIVFKNQLRDIKKIAEKKEYLKLLEICNNIPEIWKKMISLLIDDSQ